MTNTRVKREKRKTAKLAYVEHVGVYDKIPFGEYVKRLYAWAKENHVRPGLYPMGIFTDPPNATSQKDLKSQIGIQIYGEAKPGDGILITELPEMEVASISHKGPSTEYPKTYKDLGEWVTVHGYEWAGPSIEIYTRKPKLVRGETILFTKIMAQLRRTGGLKDARGVGR